MSAPAAETAVATTAAPTTTRQSKRLARREARQQRRQLREALRNMAPSESTILLVILAIFIPPLAVFLYEDGITNKFWISLLLTLLFFVPGLIYSILVVTGNV